MKAWVTASLAWHLGLLPLLLPARSADPVNCQWGSYGDWSECEACTKTQVRTRSIQVYAQFGGTPCTGGPSERRGCSTSKGCPLDEGCDQRFRCYSGQCISPALVCNGDQDCEEDGSDEQNCKELTSTTVCDTQQVPPGAELTGKGFDVLKGQLRASVMNTKSFGGQCRKVFSGDKRAVYRLPASLFSYTFQVKTDNDFSDEFYNSSWSYVKDINNRATLNQGHDYKMLHDELLNTKTYRLMVIKNQVEVAQFQNSPPEHVTLSEEFWKALASLPTVYDHSAYRMLIEDYGTHFLSEGTLGGRYQALLYIDAESMDKMSSTSTNFHECVTSTHSLLFISWSTTRCTSFRNHLQQSSGFKRDDGKTFSPIVGGHPAYIAGLSQLDLQDPGANWNMYTKWAGSVKDYPRVISQKLSPLYELVKEVPCASVKRLLLKRALEDYQAEEHPCRCQPCHNSGQPVLRATVCTCTCKAGTSGAACQQGSVLGEEQRGVIHGSWACWSAWGTCSQGQRSRTRSCSNPFPKMGGRTCSGQAVEYAACDHEEFKHLRVMDPHCFDASLLPARSCQNPPPLRNGFVLDPKDVYPVGSKIVYSCVEGYHLLGDTVAECDEDLTWKRPAQECRSTVCEAPQLGSHVTGSPWKAVYDIGETILLSCPPGKQLVGIAEILCDSSLNWSPQEETVCRTVPTEAPPMPKLQCSLGEKLVNGRCVCKMPYECTSSLEVCATNLERGRTDRLSVCKVLALTCLGRQYTLTEHSACQWPSWNVTPCTACQLWERCDEHSNMCVCRDSGNCLESTFRLCVRVGEGNVTMTMSECEAGLRRCRGEKVTAISLKECDS